MYRLYKYPILVGGNRYTLSMVKPAILLANPVYPRYIKQPVYLETGNQMSGGAAGSEGLLEDQDAAQPRLSVSVDFSSDEYKINPEKMENIIISNIGSIGSFMTTGTDGAVYNFNNETGESFVIKIALHSTGAVNLEREIRIYNKLMQNSDDYFILAHGDFIFTNDTNLNFFIFKKYDYNLLEHCSLGKKINPSELGRLESQIANFHSNNIILNDIHLGNIAVKSGRYSFSDFGRVIDLDDLDSEQILGIRKNILKSQVVNDEPLTPDEIELLKLKDFERLEEYNRNCNERNLNFKTRLAGALDGRAGQSTLRLVNSM